TERRWHASPAALGGWAPPVMGAAFAFGWTPCIGPVLGAVLSEAAARTSVVGGMILLTVYSLGLGVPFVAAGVATGHLAGVFGWVRRNYRVIAAAAGLVLAAWGALMVVGDVTLVSSWFSTVMRDLHLTRLTVS
ncbi:MAG: cytochrome c biogenesis CcdA family protein, partial [Acidimicrobiales bacterium]